MSDTSISDLDGSAVGAPPDGHQASSSKRSRTTRASSTTVSRPPTLPCRPFTQGIEHISGVKYDFVDGPSIKHSPDLIGQSDANFEATRKPLVAMWKTRHGARKGRLHRPCPLQQQARRPVNKGVEKRTRHTERTAKTPLLSYNSIAWILAKDPKAPIITAGDFNRLTQVQASRTFAAKSGLVGADEVAGVAEVERYTYLFGQNSETLDRIYISEGLSRNVQIEHLHLNTWQDCHGQRDHDPSVAQMSFCAW